MTLRVFIQNEAGTSRKHYHDEKTLKLVRVVDVSMPYPGPEWVETSREERAADGNWPAHSFVTLEKLPSRSREGLGEGP